MVKKQNESTSRAKQTIERHSVGEKGEELVIVCNKSAVAQQQGGTG